MFERLSYRVKVPLNIMLVVLLTAVITAVTLLGYHYRTVEPDLFRSGERLAGAMTPALGNTLVRDDVWGAWEIIRGPLTDDSGDDTLRPAVITLLGDDGRVFASSAPRRFPLGSEVGDGDDRYALNDLGDAGENPRRIRLEDQSLLVIEAVFVDERRVGTLLLELERPGVLDLYGGALTQAAWVTGILIVAGAPVGWWLGRRVARPLTRIGGLVDRVATETPEQLARELPDRRADGDEVARLERRFAEMLRELAEKQRLEGEVIRSERLAAVGRLSAGIAHEVNNPLGGMLNAVSNQRHRGVDDPQVARTMDLIERGLNQIRETVAALLVEARDTPHPLECQDLEDVHTLAAAQAGGVSIHRDIRLDRPLPLPATAVRQVLLNLLLNACQAAGPGGTVRYSVGCNGDGLEADVRDTGPAMAPELLEHLFEPFYRRAGEGSGLGLWVSYQIVQQLGGSIEATSAPDDTRFRVHLPIPSQERV